MDDRNHMGKEKDGVILPVAPRLSEMAVSYPDFINALIDKIQKQRIAITLNANAGMIGMYWSVGSAILKKQDEEGWGTKVTDRIRPGESGVQGSVSLRLPGNRHPQT